jgi:hypothetical protein
MRGIGSRGWTPEEKRHYESARRKLGADLVLDASGSSGEEPVFHVVGHRRGLGVASGLKGSS